MDAVDDASWENDVNWKGCRTPMTPLFENAGATFNDETGFYEMNGLTDLTEWDCINSYAFLRYSQNATVSTYLNDLNFGTNADNRRIRTNFPFIGMFKCFNKLSVYGQSKLEVLTFGNLPGINTQDVYIKNKSIDLYRANTVLRKVLGVLNVQNITAGTLDAYYKPNVLELLKIKALKINAAIFSGTPFINYWSIRYLIDNASNTLPITITVHPTTYGYLTGTIEPTPEVGGTKEEWMQIVTDATEKQITFATAE